MAEHLQLIQVAVHYIDKTSGKLELAPAAINVAALSPEIVKFFTDLAADVWDSEDTGSNRSAHFHADDHPTPSLVKQHFHDLNGPGNAFFDTTKILASSLFEKSPGSASPGLLAVLQFQHISDAKVFIALLKIRHKDESFIRLASKMLTQLDVETVEYMLLSNLQKGAIIPHPTRDDYDLKIVDKVVSGQEPAQYFSEAFLGCIAKRSDEHQIKKLLPEIQRFARAKNLELRPKKLPVVVAKLQQRDQDVTTPLLAEVVEEEQLFGTDFVKRDFETYINQESDLGQVNIPKEQFRTRGKRKRQRRITYKFTGRDLRGVTITGPAELLQDIVTFEGDNAVFRITTTPDAYDVTYE